MNPRRLIPLASALALAVALPLAARAQQGSVPARPSPGTRAAKQETVATGARRTAKHATMHAARVDLNTATRVELEKLPGVSETIADQIIAARPFKSRSELLGKKLVTKVEYERLRSHVMVRAGHLASNKSK